MKEGSSAVLLQSGLDEKWLAGSMECCCHLRVVQDSLGRWENTLRDDSEGIITFEKSLNTFSLEDGAVKLLGRDHEDRESTLRQCYLVGIAWK